MTTPSQLISRAKSSGSFGPLEESNRVPTPVSPAQLFRQTFTDLQVADTGRTTPRIVATVRSGKTTPTATLLLSPKKDRPEAAHEALLAGNSSAARSFFSLTAVELSEQQAELDDAEVAQLLPAEQEEPS